MKKKVKDYIKPGKNKCKVITYLYDYFKNIYSCEYKYEKNIAQQLNISFYNKLIFIYFLEKKQEIIFCAGLNEYNMNDFDVLNDLTIKECIDKVDNYMITLKKQQIKERTKAINEDFK